MWKFAKVTSAKNAIFAVFQFLVVFAELTFTFELTDKTATYGYFVLVNDIDFNNTALELPSWYDTKVSAGFNDGTIYPGVFFAGVFDGRGYKIRNYNTGSDVDGGRYGLFGKINNATIKNVIIEDVVYTGKNTSEYLLSCRNRLNSKI